MFIKIEKGSLQTFNSAKLLSSGIQIYFPVTEYLDIGILFLPPIGLIKIYVQQQVLTEDILLQFKVFELNTPITLTLLFFSLGIAHFFSKCFLDYLENFKVNMIGNLTKEIQRNLEEALRKTKQLNENAD